MGEEIFDEYGLIGLRGSPFPSDVFFPLSQVHEGADLCLDDVETA